MNGAKIKIISQGDGWSRREQKPCRVERGESVKIYYEQEGDNCTLTISKDSVAMVRRGETNLNMAFKEGKTLPCLIGTSGSMGETDCTTHKLVISRGGHGVNVKINYSLGGSDVTLSATVIF